jgi:hypothetical protein
MTMLTFLIVLTAAMVATLVVVMTQSEQPRPVVVRKNDIRTRRR